MLKLLFALLLCSASVIAFAQNNDAKTEKRPDSVGYYMRDETTMAYSENSANFVRLLIKTDSNMFRVNDYYMDGTPRLVAKTTIDSLNFLPGARGICYEYFPNGKRKSIKNFENGKLVGDAVTYYPNGGLHTIENHSRQGLYLKQYLDSAGTVLADNGNGKWVKMSEQQMDGYIEGPVLNGKEDGQWKRYIADTTYTIVYKQGEIISGKEFLKIKDIEFKWVEVPPSFPGGDAELNRYISQNVKYPKKARDNNIKGRVIISFVIEKDGSLTNIKLVRGIGGGCDEESLRVMSISPKWYPGLNHGKPVRVAYSIPIAFALSE